MITLLGSLLGFLASFAPDVLKMFTAAADRKHEREILKLQISEEAQKAQARMNEIGAYADIAESIAVHQPMPETGVHWVDALNGTVRPMLAYGFYLLYAIMKIMIFTHLSAQDTPWLVWTDEDGAIFASVISFYFGGRAMQKYRESRSGK